MKVTLEKVPVNHPRPFKEGDLVEFKDNGSIYLLTKPLLGLCMFDWVALYPKLGTRSHGISSQFTTDHYRLLEGCITLCNDEE